MGKEDNGAPKRRRRTSRARARKPDVRVTAEIVEECLDALADGMTLTAFCSEPDRPERRSIVRHVKNHPELAERFTAAREMGFDALAEEALELLDEDIPVDDKGRTDTGLVQQRKAQADARLRLLSKWCTARYGEKLQLGGDGEQPIRLTNTDRMERLLKLTAVAQRRRLRDLAGRSNGHEKNGGTE